MLTLPDDDAGRKEHALALAAAGFHVLPVKAGEKRPDPLLAPAGFGDATRDAEKIAGWFAVKPKCNVGIACGVEYGLLALDVDVKNGSRGMATLRELDVHVPTLTASTPSGGLHLYFKHPGGALVPQLDGIDVKGANGGGYVLAPPSTLPNGAYVWRDPEMPVLELPEHALAKLRTRPVTQRAASPVDTLKTPEGQRHNKLLQLVAGWRARGLAPDEIETLAWDHAERYFAPPFARDNPQHAREVESAVRWIGEKPAPDAAAEALTVLTCAELHARAAEKPAACLLDPILPAAGNLMIYGPAGVGKSHIALAIMLALAGGTPLLTWRAREAVPCLFVDGELPLAELSGRLAGYTRAPPENLKWLAARATSDGDLPDLADVAMQALYLEAIERTGAQVACFDNLTCLRHTAPDRPENSVEAWYPVAAFLRRLNGLGVATILVHHAGRSGLQRGSTAHTAVMDTVLQLRALGDGQADPRAANDLEIHFEKHRRFWGEDALPLRAQCLETDDDLFAWQAAGDDPLAADVARLHLEGLSGNAIAKRLKRSRSGIQKALDRAKAAGLVPL